MIWALIIGITMLLLAIIIQQWVFLVAEEDAHFLGAIGAFFILFIASAVALFWLMPGLDSRSDVGGLVNAWIGGPSAVSAAPSDLPYYGE